MVAPSPARLSNLRLVSVIQLALSLCVRSHHQYPKTPLGLDVRVHGIVNDAVVYPDLHEKIPSLLAATCDVE